MGHLKDQRESPRGDDPSSSVEPIHKPRRGPSVTQKSDVQPNVPGYRLLHTLGRGGMGTVFLAEEERLERKVALKLLDSGSSERFEREAKAMATIEHPSVVRVYAFGEAELSGEPVPFLAMEYVDGETLRERLEREGKLTTPDSLRIARETVEALEAAWSKAIVHRDVKPGNILLDRQGRVRVCDFGIAKPVDAPSGSMTATGTSLGTPNYVAPEQALGRELDFRADIYALGVVLWEMLAGRRPFLEDNPHLLIAHHIRDPLPTLRSAGVDVPQPLEDLIVRMTAKDPNQRFDSHVQLLLALQRVEAGSESHPALRTGDETPSGEMTSASTKTIRAGDIMLPDLEASPALPHHPLTGDLGDDLSTGRNEEGERATERSDGDPQSPLLDEPFQSTELHGLDAPEPGDPKEELTVLEDVLAVLGERSDLSRERRIEAEREHASRKLRFEEIKTQIVLPTLRQLMIRLHRQGHPTRLQDLGRRGVRFEFLLDSTPVARCQLEVEPTDQRRVVLRFLENMAIIGEQEVAFDDVTPEMIAQKMAAFLRRGSR